MPKQERNKQFTEIEKKIGTHLSVQKKEPIHFDEFSELKETTARIALQRGMSLAEWYRWLNYRYLSAHKYIPVEVEKQELELDLTQTKPFKQKLKGIETGLAAYRRAEAIFNERMKEYTGREPI
jgi:hypothetical protein